MEGAASSIGVPVKDSNSLRTANIDCARTQIKSKSTRVLEEAIGRITTFVNCEAISIKSAVGKINTVGA